MHVPQRLLLREGLTFAHLSGTPTAAMSVGSLKPIAID